MSRRKFFDGKTGIRIWYAYLGAVFGRVLASDYEVLAPFVSTAIIFASILTTNSLFYWWHNLPWRLRVRIERKSEGSQT